MNKEFLEKSAKQAKKSVSGRVNLPKLALVGVLLVISFLFTKNILGLTSIEDRIAVLKQKIAVSEAEHEDLSRRRKEVGTVEFIEKEARDKLGYVKQGEIVVVLPPEDYLLSLVPDLEKESTSRKKNWQRWLEIFFEDIKR